MFAGLKVRVLHREGKGEIEANEEIFHPLVYYLNGYNGQDWARLKPGSIQDSHRGVFQVHQQGTGSETG